MDFLNYRNTVAAKLRWILIFAFVTANAFPAYAGNDGSDPYAAWGGTLTLPAEPPFPAIPSFEAEYRFGWLGMGAGGASVKVGIAKSGDRTIEARGGPDAWIRKLWDYQAFYSGEAGDDGGVPSWFHMEECEGKKDILSDAVFRQGNVFACHRLTSEKKPWESRDLPGVRDLFAAMLCVRSLPLQDGDKIRLVVFPDESPYLVDLTVAGHDSLTMLGRKIHTIRFTIRIQSIETHGVNKGRLTPHRKFRSGRVWMSDDAQRLPLRAEVDIFVGKVFAEMVSCKMESGNDY